MCGGCRYCYTAAKGRDRSVWLTLFSLIFVIAAWPGIAVLQINDFPYPLTMAMLVNLIIMLIGIGLYMIECCVRGVTCCPNRRDDEYEEISVDEEGEEKGPVTFMIIVKRMIHWAMFAGLFGTIFIYASTIAQAPCQNSPNLCTVLFRSSLFLTCILSLAVIRAERRGGRLDWFIAFMLSIGISLLLWTHNGDYSVDFSQETGVLVGGFLVLLSFSGFLIALRRGVQGSSIAKTVWIQAVYGFITMVGLSSFFEGAAPWQAMVDGGFGLVWRVLAVLGICVVWVWFIVMSLAFSETLIVALSLQFSLLFGDMGVHNYIFASWSFSGTFLVGLILVLASFLWLLQKVVMLNCPNLCGKWCNWGEGEKSYDDEDLELLEEEVDKTQNRPGYRAKVQKKYGEQYLEKYRKEASYGTSGQPKSKSKW